MASLKLSYKGNMLVRATQELHELALHRRYDNMDFFQAVVPELNWPVTGVIMGAGGEAYGLHLFMGCDSLEKYRQACQNKKPSFRKLHLMGYEMLTPGEMELKSKKWIKKTDYRMQKHLLYPEFMIIEPGNEVRMPTDRDVRIMSYIVHAIIALERQGRFGTSDIENCRNIFTIHIDGQVESPDVTTSFVSMDNGQEQNSKDDAPAQIDAAMAFKLSALPKRESTWLVGVLEVCIGDTEDKVNGILVVFDLEKGPIALMPIPANSDQGIWEELTKIFLGTATPPEEFKNDLPEPGIPKCIRFTDPDLFEVANQPLGHIGIECVLEKPDSPFVSMLDEMEGGFYEMLDGQGAEKFAGQYADQSPDDDDIEAWKEADGFVKDMMFKGFCTNKRFKGKRAIKRYFGNKADADHLFDEYGRMLITEAYCEWFIAEYNATIDSDTIADQWLDDESLPMPVLDLIEARIEAVPGFYQIKVVDIDQGKIEFKDVIKGQSYLVTDFSLAGCIRSGYVLPAKIFPAGDFYFFAAAGPILTPEQLEYVFDFLDSQKNSYTNKEVFFGRPEIMGWLWNFYDNLVADK